MRTGRTQSSRCTAPAAGIVPGTSLGAFKLLHYLRRFAKDYLFSCRRKSVMVAVGDIEQVPDHVPPTPAWEEPHMVAVNLGEKFYEDPETGLMVMTEHAHRSRGKCCGSGCRHCPFAHESVPVERRATLNHSPTWLVPPTEHLINKSSSSRTPVKSSGCDSVATNAEQPAAHNSGASPRNADTPSPTDPRAIIVLFWSTGKDSFLALRALQRVAAGCATPKDPPVNVRASPAHPMCPTVGVPAATRQHAFTASRHHMVDIYSPVSCKQTGRCYYSKRALCPGLRALCPGLPLQHAAQPVSIAVR